MPTNELLFSYQAFWSRALAAKKMFHTELSEMLYKEVIFVVSCYALLYEKIMRCFGQKKREMQTTASDLASKKISATITV